MGEIAAAAIEARGHGLDFGRRQRRNVDDLESRRRIAQEPMGAVREPGGQDEARGTCAEPRHKIALHLPQAREILERADVQYFVAEKDRRRRARRGRAIKETHEQVERGSR